MKLREFGFIMWYLAGTKTLEDRELGDIVWQLRELVDDWALENSVNEGNNADWIREDYNGWQYSQQHKHEQEALSDD